MIAQLHKQSLLGKQMIAYLLHIRDTSFGTSGSFSSSAVTPVQLPKKNSFLMKTLPGQIKY